jgi:hypothetical protein|tara:strand:+ start:5069 stop:5596 length:528 start_codon:yes stop_codon:yes gene_type:complete
MAKGASNFKLIENGFYPTPEKAVAPLRLFIGGRGYSEPCAGDGALVRALAGSGVCLQATDIAPQGDDVEKADVFSLTECKGDMFITNPPWPEQNRGGDPALSIIKHLMKIAPTWVLLPSDFAFNKYFGEVSAQCAIIVAVGRVKWFADSAHTGKSNCAWYFFNEAAPTPTLFVGR